MKKLFIVQLIATIALLSCKKNTPTVEENTEDTVENNLLPAPPTTWQENWFEHDQLLKLVDYNDRVALYFDADVDTTAKQWLLPFIDEVWTYTRSVYGNFGEGELTNRLFGVFHTGKYGGGHPFMYYDANRLYRNGIDIGAGNDAWLNQTDWEKNVIVHEIAHIVEMGGKGVKDSPAHSGIWGDSKWAEIFIYDVYKNLGRDDDMTMAYNDFMPAKDDFPRPNTIWFRDWFFPVYEQYGASQQLNKYFQLLADNFPQRAYPVIGQEYTRSLNMGEFIHFWSGSAGVDLYTRARLAFGSNDRNGNSWLKQLEKAKTDFSNVTYEVIDPYYGQDLSHRMTLAVSQENINGAEGPEGSLKMIDFDQQSKFFTKSPPTNFYVQQTSNAPIIANSYIISSANDAPDRDLKSWQITASNDGENWDILDTKENHTFEERNASFVFDFNNNTAYRYYRLVLLETAGSPDLQLSEWRLSKK